MTIPDATPDRPWLTPLLNRIADVAGIEAAMALGREKACQRIYIPETMTADHWLAQLVGFDAATRISDTFGSQKLVIPPALAGDKRRRASSIAQMIDKGYSTKAIASALGVAQSTVAEHRAKRPDDRQFKLI